MSLSSSTTLAAKTIKSAPPRGRDLVAEADGYRLTLYVLQDDRPVLKSFPGAPLGPIGVPEEVYLVVGGILADDVVELYALDSSYGGRLWFLGLEVGMVLEPSHHILGDFFHL